jgi:AcrR family transcriptional regulator
VAKEAGISKGGLLYHFKTKDSIIQGLLERPMKNYIEKMRTYVESQKDANGKWTRAYLYESVNQLDDEREMWLAGLLAALTAKPKLMEELYENFGSWQANIENDGIDTVDATIIRLATDGFWFLNLFGFQIINDDTKEKVIERLMELSKGEIESH